MRVKELADNRKLNTFPSVNILFQTKKLALRRGIWFKILNRVERGIIDLTVKCVDDIRSVRLAKLVTAIIDKLHSALESTVDRLVRTIGLPLARKISNIANKWGNHLASLWANDLEFARFLVFNFVKES
jgi:hypothetical protein